MIFVTGLNPEAEEDDVLDKFGEFGAVKSIALNLDRRTGYAKGYVLMEYATRAEGEAAIKGMNGAKILGKEVAVNWAFLTK